MKSTKQILEYICDRIGHIYFRPLMYVGNPSGIDLILHYYHELWAEILERHEDYVKTRNHFHDKEGCGSAGFSNCFMLKYPDASEEDSTKYVVEQWKKISAELNVPIDYKKLSKQLNIAVP